MNLKSIFKLSMLTCQLSQVFRNSCITCSCRLRFAVAAASRAATAAAAAAVAAAPLAPRYSLLVSPGTNYPGELVTYGTNYQAIFTPRNE